MGFIRKAVTTVVAGGTIVAGTLGITGGVAGSRMRDDAKTKITQAQAEEAAAPDGSMQRLKAGTKELAADGEDALGRTSQVVGGVFDAGALTGAALLAEMRRRRLKNEAKAGQAKS